HDPELRVQEEAVHGLPDEVILRPREVDEGERDSVRLASHRQGLDRDRRPAAGEVELQPHQSVEPDVAVATLRPERAQVVPLAAPYPKPSEEPGHPDGLMKPHAEVAHPDVPQHRPVDPSPPDLLSDRTRIPITGMEAVELGEASHEDRAGWLPGCRDAITPRS